MPVWKWSQTAATNATADSTINWAEGQAPSTVNDSARAMMAATAKWRDDISATITTGGSATAYTLSTNSVYDSLAHMGGALISFIPHTINTSATQTTLAVDGLTAQPLRRSPGVELQPGDLAAGSAYLFAYSSGDAAFYQVNTAQGIPAGTLSPFAGITLPNGWLWCDGSAVARATYAALFAQIGIAYGAGNGSTTFNVPDMGDSVPLGVGTIGVTAPGTTETGGFLSGSGVGVAVFPVRCNYIIKY